MNVEILSDLLPGMLSTETIARMKMASRTYAQHFAEGAVLTYYIENNPNPLPRGLTRSFAYVETGDYTKTFSTEVAIELYKNTLYKYVVIPKVSFGDMLRVIMRDHSGMIRTDIEDRDGGNVFIEVIEDESAAETTIATDITLWRKRRVIEREHFWIYEHELINLEQYKRQTYISYSNFVTEMSSVFRYNLLMDNLQKYIIFLIEDSDAKDIDSQWLQATAGSPSQDFIDNVTIYNDVIGISIFRIAKYGTINLDTLMSKLKLYRKHRNINIYIISRGEYFIEHNDVNE